jgi:hypothetical protein
MAQLDFKLVIDCGSQYLYFAVNAATWDFERTENPLSMDIDLTTLPLMRRSQLSAGSAWIEFNFF